MVARNRSLGKKRVGKWLAGLLGLTIPGLAAAPAMALAMALESNQFRGSVTYDPTATTCPSACPVTDLGLHNRDSYASFRDVIGLATVDLSTAPDSLNAVLTVHGRIGLHPITSTLFAGLFSAHGAGTFQSFDRSGALADGTLSLAPLPRDCPCSQPRSAASACSAAGREPASAKGRTAVAAGGVIPLIGALPTDREAMSE